MKLKLYFPEFPFLRTFRVALAKGEICKRFGQQHKAGDRSALAAHAAHCWSVGSPGCHGAMARLAVTPAPTTSPVALSDSWARCVSVSVRKVPASPAGYLYHQRWSTRGKWETFDTMCVPAHSVGSGTSSWVLICPCSPLFHTRIFFPTDYPVASGPRNIHRSNSLSYCLSHNCTVQISITNPFYVYIYI